MENHLNKKTHSPNRLSCEICISPGETHIVESVEWYFNSSTNSSVFNEPVELNEHTLESPEDKTLLIYNIQVKMNR